MNLKFYILVFLGGIVMGLLDYAIDISGLISVHKSLHTMNHVIFGMAIYRLAVKSGVKWVQ